MPTFEFLNHYTLEDHGEVLALTRKKTLKKQRERILWWLLFIVGGFWALWRLEVQGELLWLFAGVLVGWATYLSASWKQQRQHWIKLWEENSSFRDELRTHLDSDGLRAPVPIPSFLVGGKHSRLWMKQRTYSFFIRAQVGF